MKMSDKAKERIRLKTLSIVDENPCLLVAAYGTSTYDTINCWRGRDFACGFMGCIPPVRMVYNDYDVGFSIAPLTPDEALVTQPVHDRTTFKRFRRLSYRPENRDRVTRCRTLVKLELVP